MTDLSADYGPGRSAPQALEAEEAVLGCILIDPQAYFDVAPILRPDDFYLHKHRWVWDAIVRLHDQRLPVDTLTLTEELERHSQLAEVGGTAFLARLLTSVPTSLHAEAYARLIEREATRRRLMEAATAIAKLAAEEERDINEVVNEAESTIFAVSERKLTKDITPIKEAISDYYDRLKYLAEHGNEFLGVPTGFVDLDKLLGGLQKSDLLIVAGRPGSGKCLAADSEILLRDGSVTTIEAIYQKKSAQLLTLHENLKLTCAEPSDFVDDGIRPTFKVTTWLGRSVESTGSHPFLTLRGWQPLSELKPGDRIAVPRRLPIFGKEELRECEIKLLAYLLGDGCLVHRSPEFTVGKPALRQDFEEAVNEFGGVRSKPLPSTNRTLTLIVANAEGKRGRGVKNPLTDWLRSLGVYGKNSHKKFIPACVFTLRQPLMALFLNRLFATDGWASSTAADIGYATVSEKLARQLQHLLLRFGVIARLRQKRVAYQNTRRLAWYLEISDAPSLLSFIDQIGIYGKEANLKKIKQVLHNRKANTNTDTVPTEIWETIRELKGPETWVSLAHRAGIQATAPKINMHVGTRSLSRERLSKLAAALQNWPLHNLATSDVFWDKIKSIEATGQQQVYDLTIPDTHNFIANDICVHNTGLMLNIAKAAAQTYRKHVAVFSLEMSNEQLVQRLISQETGIDSRRLRMGELRDEEWPLLVQAASVMSEAQIFLDDTPGISPTQLRSKCRRLDQEFGLDLIVVDYLQLMQGDRRNENRVQEVSDISRKLKLLARELNVPVLAGAQLSRAVEQRGGDKRPILSDLRESGSLEQDSDIVMFIHRPDMYEDENSKTNIANLIIAKHRNGPTGDIQLIFRGALTKFENAETRRVDLQHV